MPEKTETLTILHRNRDSNAGVNYSKRDGGLSKSAGHGKPDWVFSLYVYLIANGYLPSLCFLPFRNTTRTVPITVFSNV